MYDVKGILEKNRDTFRDDILNMLKDSRWDAQEKLEHGLIITASNVIQFVFVFVFLHRLDFIYDLFEKVGSRNNEEKMGTARRKPTVSSQFRVSEVKKVAKG